jgi:hypothetical protein
MPKLMVTLTPKQKEDKEFLLAMRRKNQKKGQEKRKLLFVNNY